MSQNPLFDITPEHILALDDEGLRLLIARLCKADLRCRALPVSAVPDHHHSRYPLAAALSIPSSLRSVTA
jgi:hypothetical protein